MNLHFPSICAFSAPRRKHQDAVMLLHTSTFLFVWLWQGVWEAQLLVCVCVLCLWLWEHWLAPCSPPQTVAPTLSKLQPPLLAPRLYIPEKKRKEKKRKEKAEWRKERAVIEVELASRSRHEEDRVSEVCHNNGKKDTFIQDVSRVTPAHTCHSRNCFVVITFISYPFGVCGFYLSSFVFRDSV